MASPAGVTMPDFEVLEGFLYVLKKGTAVIGQALRVQAQSQIPSRKVARLGDTSKKTTRAPTEHTANLEIYAEADVDQLGKILGVTKPASGGWVGTEKISLNPSIAAADYTLEVYNAATGTGDTKMGTWTLKNFVPTSLTVAPQADAVVTHQINGECDDIYYTPAAGTGA